MRFKYTYRNTGFDLWQLSMYYIYGSMAGVCNVMFTVAMFALVVAKWSLASTAFKLCIVLGCCLFPVIQPLFLYLKAKKQAAGIKEDTEVCFADSGIYIKVGDRTSDISWNKIKRVAKKPTMIIVFSDTVHGFVFTNRIIGKDREDFFKYLASKLQT